eukprot:TRINITY_DN1514_c0_g1_i3.p1 TRINITY_DN1514_c0_g1~~TRINITY_DN1514_c0_g1_i3.p1  ORF type:complete len:305 (-),score=85.74 TRINITY_DN1514_c0_g1_i3:201-1115(-)
MATKEEEVVLITGCSEGGIGFELALTFARSKCRVIASARRLESMAALEKEGIDLVQLDVTSSDSVKAAVETVLQKEGHIDILVNNAGVLVAGPIVEIPMSTIQRMFDTNVMGVIAVTQAVVPSMVKRRKGKIINIGSIGGWLGMPFGGIYSATKAAIHTFTHVLRVELLPFNIQVMVLSPGTVRSRLATNACKVHGGELEQPQWKMYSEFQAAIDRRRRISESATHAMETELFAQTVVKKVLQKQIPRVLAIGGHLLLMRLLLLLPWWLADFLRAQAFGLHRNSAAARSKLAPEEHSRRIDKTD